MSNHFTHHDSKIVPATAPMPSLAETLRAEVVRAILARIQANVAFTFGVECDLEAQERAFRRLLIGHPRMLPPDFIGDDPLEAVAAKFRVVFETVRDMWAERQGIDWWRLPLRIHPSIEGETYVDILYQPAHPSGRVFLLYTMGAKAGHFWFESLNALEEAIGNLYQTLDAERQWAHRALALSNASPWIVRLHRGYSVLQNIRRGLSPAR